MEPESQELSLELDPEILQENIDEYSSILEENQRRQTEIEGVQAQEEQSIAEQDDPRNAEKWGTGAVAKEVSSAIHGGVQKTLSSVTTFPERTVDALSGEMSRERREKGYYRPEWDPFENYDNPIITKTWWGQLLEGTVHFGTLAAAIIPTAKATLGRVGLAGAWAGTSSLIRAAGVGAVSDLISKESDGHNALGMLRDRYGLIDTPISTKDTDHPIWMKFKNIAEGIGIGMVFDSASLLLGKGSKAVKTQISNRQKSVDIQTNRKGVQELRRNEFGFRGSKNKTVADSHQAAHISQDDPFVVWEQQKRIRNEWGAEDGSTASVTTPIQRERIAREADISEEMVEDVLQRYTSSEKYQKIVESVKASRQRLVDVFGDSIAAHQRITQGRNAVDMSAEEYLMEIFESSDVYSKGTPDEIVTITSKNVVVVDLVVGSLLRQLRDLGIAGREIADFADLMDIDGPADQIMDTMLTALTEAKRARIVKSQNFRELGAGKRRYLQETLAKDMADTRDSIMSILQIAKDDPDENLLNALFEAFSQMKEVNNLDDFDAWARKVIKGGEIGGKKQTGVLIKELEGMMVNSILSGPKTPIRALMGTSTATFLRPFATTLGATLRYPFDGDSTTIRAGLSSLNAMMETIPEAFDLFKSRLNSYWKGDLSTIKSRFAEFNRGDGNWELMRKWVEESGRSTVGDKVAFSMANMARAVNDNSFFSAGTRIMASMDDTFAYLLGRAKMREKAMRSALDAKAKGVLTAYTEITPDLIKVFEEDFYRQIFDANGNIIDKATQFARKEVTLTQELTGFVSGLNQVFQANPWAKPFFLFARTGINGLQLTAKHTPGFNFLVKEFNDVAFATKSDIKDLVKYGITNEAELMNAKALQTGRLAIGSAVVSLASWAWLRGDMTGNGPADRQKRQGWIDAGYKTRTVKLPFTDVYVGYDAFEPFNQIMSTIADVGDASQLMGEEWTERELQKIALVVGQSIASKSYLAGLQQFVDLFGGRPGQGNRILAGLMNNQVPLAGLRNEIGKIITPYTRELNSGIADALRNRNLISEHIADNELPIKYDLLNGKPIKEHDPMTRMWNAVIPVNFNLESSPGRQLLFNSGYDLRLSTYYSPDGYDLTNSPEIRSMFQKAIGDLNLEHQLNKLSRNKRILASIAEMKKDIEKGNRGDYEPGDYYHNIIIGDLFDDARQQAWLNIRKEDVVIDLIQEEDIKTLERRQKKYDTSELLLPSR